MEMLKASNWMPWKRRMLAVLRDLGLEKYIEKDSKIPESAGGTKTKEEEEAQQKWHSGDAKTRTRIELEISDAEMIHISGAQTAREMWDQLTMVKESKGRLGILATRRALYRANAEEGFDMVEHISSLRKLQEELHLMDNKVPDEDFVMILITSLPESWDNYTSSYLGSSGNKPTLTSHELIAILMEEDRRRKGQNGDSAGASLQAKNYSKGGCKNIKLNVDSNTECYNCHKKGHLAKDCWAKGGGKEGQGPKGRKGPNRANRSNQAQETNSNLNEVSYVASENYQKPSKYDWYLDSGTTSHICTQRDAFIDYYPLENSTVNGVRPTPAIAVGRGTVIVNFSVNGKIIPHQLKDVIHLPNAPNCLISATRIDDAGGSHGGGNGKCFIKDKTGKTVGTGVKKGKLYLLDARAQLLGQERTNYANNRAKLTWDQWHKCFGHIAIPSLEHLHRENMVDGMAVD